MSDPKAARLAAIRAANAQRQAAAAAAVAVTPAPSAAAAHIAEDTSSGSVVTVTVIPPQTSPPPRCARHPLSAAERGLGVEVGNGAEHDNRPTSLAQAAPVTTPTVRLPGPSASAATALSEQAPALGAPQIGLLLLAAAGGAFIAAFALPAWLPGLSASLLGPEPKAYWYLSRSTAFVAYGLLWLSMALGLMMTNKLARLWPGGPLAFDLHEHASILGLAFGLFHALILLGDSYSSYTLAQILTPFASGGYAPVWVGLGQVSLYLMGIVGLSFYIRPLIGRQGWRLIHFISFAIFGLVLLHGVLSGSDTGTAWAQAIYWLSGGSLLFLTVYRVLVSIARPTPVARSAPATRAPREQLVEA